MKLLMIAILIALSFSLLAQSEQFAFQADTAYEKRNFKVAASLYEKAASTSSDVQMKGLYLYNAACSYGLMNDTTIALQSLKKSLEVSSGNGNTPVTADHLLQDLDLHILWNMPAFKELIKTYFKHDSEKILRDLQPRKVTFQGLCKIINEKVAAGETTITISNYEITTVGKIENTLISDKLTINFQLCRFLGNQLRIASEFSFKELIFNHCEFENTFRLQPDLKFAPKFTACIFKIFIVQIIILSLTMNVTLI